MSESIEITVEIRGEEFEVDVAGLAGPDDFYEVAKEAFNDRWSNEDAPAGTDTSTPIDGECTAKPSTADPEFEWLFDSLTVEGWEWEWLEFLGNCDSYITNEICEAACDCGIAAGDVDEAYQGAWPDDADFAYQLCIDIGVIPSDLPSYIYVDWEKTARDIMMDYCESNGHYFRNL